MSRISDRYDRVLEGNWEVTDMVVAYRPTNYTDLEPPDEFDDEMIDLWEEFRSKTDKRYNVEITRRNRWFGLWTEQYLTLYREVRHMEWQVLLCVSTVGELESFIYGYINGLNKAEGENDD